MTWLLPAHYLVILVFGILLITLLCALAQADLKGLILPNFLNLALGIGGIAQAFTLGDPTPIAAALGALFGGASMGMIAQGYRTMRGFDGLGMGDIKFVGAAGFWIGWEGIPLMLLFASLTALAFVGCLLVLNRAINRRTRIPFGPFLGGGTLFTWLLQKAV